MSKASRPLPLGAESRRRRARRRLAIVIVMFGVGGTLWWYESREEESKPVSPHVQPAPIDEVGPRQAASTDYRPRSARHHTSFRCTVDRIIDGDTFVCSEADDSGKPIHVRLSGISARERDETCHSGHPCPAASALAATVELARLAHHRVLECQFVGRSYERVAAFCSRLDGVDVNCAMLASGTTARWERYLRRHSCL